MWYCFLAVQGGTKFRVVDDEVLKCDHLYDGSVIRVFLFYDVIL